MATHGWLETSEVRGVDFCRRLRDTGVKTVIYTDISRDGKMQGTNLELYKELSQIEGWISWRPVESAASRRLIF